MQIAPKRSKSHWIFFFRKENWSIGQIVIWKLIQILIVMTKRHLFVNIGLRDSLFEFFVPNENEIMDRQ